MVTKVAVAGAGVYGSSIAIKLAENGCVVDLFDPLGVMRAASAINQYRIHSGYHYPRSSETIEEILGARNEFISTYRPAIVRTVGSYYAIPRRDSLTTPDDYEQTMSHHGLALRECRPDWLNYGYVDRCYEVDENIYSESVLRDLLIENIRRSNVRFHQKKYPPESRSSYDYLIWATYGLGESRHQFHSSLYQIAEKVLVEFPAALRNISLVVVDGPFTAFDPYASTSFSMFGSAKYTNHWSTEDPEFRIPERFAGMLNGSDFVQVPFTNFNLLKDDCCLSVPLAAGARYIGSRFTIRVVENDSKSDRRILSVKECSPGEFHVFSGKVVGAAKAARIICRRIVGD